MATNRLPARELDSVEEEEILEELQVSLNRDWEVSIIKFPTGRRIGTRGCD
jgi:hypothetical protein